MPAFDWLGVDPSPEQTAKVMVQAVESANKRCRIGKLTPDPASYRRFADGMGEKAEGVARWIEGVGNREQCPPHLRATLLAVTWWTDALGQRHVRVAGRRLEPFNEFHRNRFGPLAAERPPLALVYPEGVVVRGGGEGKGSNKGVAARLVAVCGCGVIGNPARLAWMGPHCGPCHDRLEESGNLPYAPWTLEGHTTPLHGVAFNTTGKALVSCGQHGDLVFWDVAARKSKRRREPHSNGLQHSAFACNGKTAFVSSYYEGMAWFNATRGTPEGVWDQTMVYGYDRLALAPDGKTVAGGDWAHLEVWSVPRTGRPKLLQRVDGHANCVCFSPDSQMLAVGWDHTQTLASGSTNDSILVIALPAGNRRPLAWRSRHPIQATAFSPDGKAIAVSAGFASYQVHPDTFERLPSQGSPFGETVICDATTGKLRSTLGETGSTCRSLRFDPTGGILATGSDDGVVSFWDVAEGRSLMTLEWHVGAVTHLAFTPDGELLATGGADGLVRLWPWRRLLDES